MKISEFARRYDIDPNLAESQIIQEFLIKEYGHLIKSVKNITNVELSEVVCSDLKYHERVVRQYSSLDLSNYKNLELPIIVLKENLHLIDGYHRLTLALKEGRATLPAYIIS